MEKTAEKPNNKNEGIPSKAKERAKSGLLAALILMMIILAGLTWVYEPSILPPRMSQALYSIVESLGGAPAGPPAVVVSRSDSFDRAVYPVRVAAILSDGRYCAEYSAAENAFRAVSNIVGEAISSSRLPVQIRRTEWQGALAQPGVYVEYTSAVPVSYHALMLGVSPPDYEDTYTDRLFFSAAGNEIVIYFREAGSGGYYKSGTITDSVRLISALDSEFAQGESAAYPGFIYSFESDIDFSALENELVITRETVELQLYGRHDTSVSDATNDILLEVFGMNPLSTYSRAAEDGGMVSIDDMRSITVTADGTIIYTDNGGDSELGIQIRQSAGVPTVIEELRRIAARFESMAGEAKIGFEAIAGHNGRTVVTFRYYLDGIPVYDDEGIAPFYFELENGILTSARLSLKRFSLPENRDTIKLLPLRQAALLAGSHENAGDGSAELGICYKNRNGVLYPEWTVD